MCKTYLGEASNLYQDSSDICAREKFSLLFRPILTLLFRYGWGAPERTRGSNHIRYLLANQTVRLTTNVSISLIMNEVTFFLEEPIYLVLMPDESLTISPGEYFSDSLEKTTAYWDSWFAALSVRLGLFLMQHHKILIDLSFLRTTKMR